LAWYAAKDPRVTVIDGGDTQIGAGPARNIGALAAKAPIIGICDDDDVYPDERAQKILAWFEAHPECELVTAPYVAIGYNNQIIQGYRGEAFNEAQFKKDGSVNYFCNPSAAMKREAALAIPYPRETKEKTDDVQFVESWINAGKKIDFAPDDYLCMHRVLPTSMMADKRGFNPAWVR
jgi:glycosyltransferase involved in cell wall biosynthesis